MNAMNDSFAARGTFTRQDVRFDSGETYCSGWLYLPEGVEHPPVVVLGHGLGATREMRLDAFAERFAAAGIATLAFTYRYFGDSGGHPRQLMSVKRQLEDWDAALAFVKQHDDVDGERLAVWGSSFGGGHAITVASRHPELRAAVSQCPFTDGLASAAALGVMGSLKVTPVVLRDFAAKLLGRPPVMVPIAAAPGQPALMKNSPGVLRFVTTNCDGVQSSLRCPAADLPADCAPVDSSGAPLIGGVLATISVTVATRTPPAIAHTSSPRYTPLARPAGFTLTVKRPGARVDVVPAAGVTLSQLPPSKELEEAWYGAAPRSLV